MLGACGTPRRSPGGEAYLYMEMGYGPESHSWSVDDMARWVCSVCDYEYVEGAGDPATGIPPGTRFEDLPDDWRCPDCGAGKEAFMRAGEEEETNDEDAL